jgi:hypothetical protein
MKRFIFIGFLAAWVYVVFEQAGAFDLHVEQSFDEDEEVERYRSAMRLAADPAEKRRVLANVGRIDSFASLNLVMTFLSTEGIQSEAAASALAIARRIHPANLGMSRIIVERLAKVSSDPEVTSQAMELLERIVDLSGKQPGRRFPAFKVHVLNADSRFEAGAIVDLNNDGKPDVFSGGLWYEAPDWTRHRVREVTEQDGYYLDFGTVVADVDGDGRQDIVNGSWHGQDVFWLRNKGKGDFEVIPIDRPGNLETVIGFDISGDGRVDILPNTVGSMQWYQSKPDAGSPWGVRWVRHDLPKETAGHGVGVGDLNGDGRVDIVTPKGWLEQPPLGQAEWTWHPDFNLGSTSVPIIVHDVDSDGDADLVWGNGHGYGIYWLEQQVRDGKSAWVKHLIDRTWSQPHFWLLADLDLDGRPELVTGKRYYAHNGNDPGADHPLCIYAYQYDLADKAWVREPVHEGGRVGFGIFTTAADMDGDGDIDLLAPGKSGLYLLENLLRSR